MSEIKKKEFYVLELSKDFFIEAEDNEKDKCYDFWLCRDRYCIKVFMHGLPWEYHDSLVEAVRFVGDLVDSEYLAPYLDDLLDDGEEIDCSMNIIS